MVNPHHDLNRRHGLRVEPTVTTPDIAAGAARAHTRPSAASLRAAAAVVEVRGVSKVYRLGKREVPALRNVSMVVAERRFLAIAGPSGSGKSTLLNLIGCIDSPYGRHHRHRQGRGQ